MASGLQQAVSFLVDTVPPQIPITTGGLYATWMLAAHIVEATLAKFEQNRIEAYSAECEKIKWAELKKSPGEHELHAGLKEGRESLSHFFGPG